MNIDKLSEAYIQTQIIAYLRKAGVYFRRLNVIAARGHKNPLTNGVPDLLCFYKQRTIFIEVKQAKGKMSDEQLAFQINAEKNGQNYVLARSVDDVVRWMNRL
jgi:hypothetical protein